MPSQPALPVSGPHSFFLASAAPPPIVPKLGRQMSSMSSIGEVANACDLSSLVDLSDLQTAALSALASKSFASFGDAAAAPKTSASNHPHAAGPDSPTDTSETTDIVPPGFVPPPPTPPSAPSEETFADVAAALTSKALSKALLGEAVGDDDDSVPPGYVPPPPDVVNSVTMLPTWSRAPSFSWIDNCLKSTPTESAASRVSYSKSNNNTPGSGVASSNLPTPEKTSEKKPPPLLCKPAPRVDTDLDEMSMLPMPEAVPPVPRKMRSREWGRVSPA